MRHGPTVDARESLQAALTGSYTIERELGGGGMSRVFVATEQKLKRRVVVKVLPAELAAAVSAERFEREILVAAGLTQANIVPVLASGQVDGVPWYSMPFIEGESLRLRLQRGPLSERDAVSVLRDVARALAYAHEHGVIHRDIKPDNVLLSGDTAVVTDFGIAKAISAARTLSGSEESTGLTQLGTAIGTPAYIAPEQAAGDPDTDHRADLYSFGCLAFELLTGRRPFTETQPHRLMAAHMSARPPRLAELIADANPALETLVAACLAKSPAERPQSARDVLAQLDSALSSSPSGGSSIAMSKQTSLAAALGIWAAAFAATWILARAAVVGIGLPDWTVALALGVCTLGLPAVLFTWYVQRTAHSALVTTPTRTPGGTAIQSTMGTLALRAAPMMSWKRTWRGGMIAGVSVVGSLAAVMGLRALGIGPAASLLNAGRIDRDSRVLVAQFQSGAADTSLGTVVAQAMRTSLGQSNAVQLVSMQDVAASLRRMKLPDSAPLDDSTAAAMAERDGIPLIVTGRVAPLGAGFMVSASLVRADSGVALLTLQQGANGAADLLDAVDKVARNMRSRIGENLRSLARTPALAEATTSSIDALREYTRAVEAGDVRGDFARGLEHLQIALAADSTFAMAWRKRAVYASNAGKPLSEAELAASQAYRLRERLSDAERWEVEAYYLRNRHSRPAAAYYAAHPALSQNNRALLLNALGEYANADSVATADIARNDARGTRPAVQLLINQLSARVFQGHKNEALQSVARMQRDYPGSVAFESAQAWIASLVSLDSLETMLERGAQQRAGLVRASPARAAVSSAIVHGHVRRIAVLSRAAATSERTNRSDPDPFGSAAADLVAEHGLRGSSERGIAALDSLAAVIPESGHRLDRGDLQVAAAYAQLGRVDRAKAFLAKFESGATRDDQFLRWGQWQAARGEIALAEGRTNDAIVAFRASTYSDSGDVERAWFGRTDLRLARAFDKAGNVDSTIAHLEALRQPGMRIGQFIYSPSGFAIATRRLGELYEARGELAKAIENYQAFVTLWRDADPELQPQVADAKARITRLRAAEARQR